MLAHPRYLIYREYPLRVQNERFHSGIGGRVSKATEYANKGYSILKNKGAVDQWIFWGFNFCGDPPASNFQGVYLGRARNA